jgi:enterochelin esterase-like enzyme
MLPMPTDSPQHRLHDYEDRLRERLDRPIDARARRVTIRSAALGIAKSFYVSLPPGYHSIGERERRYPVIFFFRGHEREWVHRRQDRTRHGRTVVDVYRSLLDEGKAGPMILVFPGTSSEDNRVPGLLVNFRQPELVAETPGIGTGRFEDYFVSELVPYVDAHYRTIARREGRAVEGFSLGGYQAVKIAAQHPELFVSVGAFDGTFLYATRGGRSVRQNDRVFRNPMLSPIFGEKRDLAYAAANSPANLLLTGDREALTGVQWLIRSGPEDAEPWHSNYYRCKHLTGILAERGLENGVDPVLRGATHSWYWADRHAHDAIQLHWQAMAKYG